MARLAAALADRYRIDRELGAGGMATVYLADDLKHGRRVAIKVLRPELGAALGADRFLREIETTAALRHPHILPLYDSGEADGQLFYVMPFVEGETLRDRITRERQLPSEAALTIAREVADALAYAHARGVVHRDIKPENILLESGHAVVADFGIARAVTAAGGDRLTQTGLAIGTPIYMSPEQAAGESDVDGRSDLYSLGCVLFEMLAGQPPFTGPNAQAITRQHLLASPPSLSNFRPNVSADVEGLLTQALAKSPADRMAKAEQFVASITGAQHAAISGAGQAASGAGARRAGSGAPVSRTPSLGTRIALGVIAVFVLAAGYVGLRSLRGRAAPAIERIAVLPLDNRTGDEAQLFFADGMTRELIGVLSEVGVRVLGHRAVAAYRETTEPSAGIAKALGVDALVTGAVLRSGDQVQVSIELVDPRTSETLWGQSFTRPGTDVVTLQRQIAGEIARGIHARLTPEQAQRLTIASTVNPRAYAEYLLGQQQANLRTPDGFAQSFVHFGRSLAIDSTFAPAWAAMAMSSAYALIYQTAPRDSARALLERSAERAMALDDALGDPYYALATLRLHMDWEFAEADRLYREGRRRAASNQAFALYGWTSWEMGRTAEIEETMRRMVEQEPTTAQWRSDRAWGYWSSRQLQEARASAESAVRVDSAYYEAHDILSLILMDLGDHEGAARAHASAVAAAGGDYWVRQFNEGMLAAARGDLATVRRLSRELDGDPRLAQRAALRFLLADTAGMYRLFEQAVAERDPDILQIMNGMPILYSIRKEPRFQRLMERVGIPEDLR